jgi:hypothetical protein
MFRLQGSELLVYDAPNFGLWILRDALVVMR